MYVVGRSACEMHIAKYLEYAFGVNEKVEHYEL